MDSLQDARAEEKRKEEEKKGLLITNTWFINNIIPVLPTCTKLTYLLSSSRFCIFIIISLLWCVVYYYTTS